MANTSNPGSSRPPQARDAELDGYHLPGERARAASQRQATAQHAASLDVRPGAATGGSGGGHGGYGGGGPGRPGSGGGSSGPAPRRGGSVVGALLFYVGLAATAVLVFAAAFLFGSSPDALVRSRLVEAVKAQTGRDLVIAGGTSFKFYPALGVVMRDVTLSAPPAMGGAPTARIASIEASVTLSSLIKRRIDVERLVIRDGVFDLRVDKQGRRSWQFAAASGAPDAVRYAEVRPAGVASDATRGLPAEAKDFLNNADDQRARDAGATPAAGGRLARLDDLTLGDVRIDNGTITYTDERAGKTQRITAINATLATRSLDSPLETKGSLSVQDERIEFEGRLTSLKTLIGQQPAKLVFNAAAEPVKASFDGMVNVRDVVGLDGAFAMSSPSARRLGAWAGAALPPSEGFGPMAIKGALRAAGTSLDFRDASFELDGATATGRLSLDAGGARPLIKADLKLSALDLNKYLADGPAPAAGKNAAAPAAASAAKPTAAQAPAGPAAGAGPQSIDDLLKHAPAAPAGAAGPAVKGYTKRAGWSEEPIRLAALGLADVDAALDVGSVTVREIRIGASRLKVALQDRNLKTTIDDMALYDGHARGLITVDGTGETPKVTASLAADGIAAQPLLKDAADLDWLSGTGKLQLGLGGVGQTEKQIVDSLDGTASFAFANGAVAGFNVPQMLRGLSQGQLGNWKSAPTEKTDFSELSASFAVKQGVASNQDLMLASPLLRVSGSGQIMLGAREIDYTARPKVVGSLAGQGGGVNLTGLEVPVRIRGSWDKPDVTPDVQSVLKSSTVQEIIKDPNKAVEAAKEIGKQLGGKKAGNLLKGLLGGN